jgi:hypothetical protein
MPLLRIRAVIISCPVGGRGESTLHALHESISSDFTNWPLRIAPRKTSVSNSPSKLNQFYQNTGLPVETKSRRIPTRKSHRILCCSLLPGSIGHPQEAASGPALRYRFQLQARAASPTLPSTFVAYRKDGERVRISISSTLSRTEDPAWYQLRVRKTGLSRGSALSLSRITVCRRLYSDLPMSCAILARRWQQGV